jgi:hypothetical protein
VTVTVSAIAIVIATGQELGTTGEEEATIWIHGGAEEGKEDATNLTEIAET